MKRLLAIAAGVLLAASLSTAATAAQTGPSQKHQQGFKNVKKAQQSKSERDKKVREAKKKGFEARQLAQNRK